MAFVLVGLGMLIRAYLVGRGPWGNLYEFSVAFAFGIMLGYLYLSRRYPIRAIAFLPIGVAFFLLAYAFTLPAGDQPARARARQRAAADDPRRDGDAQLRHLRGELRRGRGLPDPGPREPRLVAAAGKVLDEVAYRAVIIGFPIFATLIILGSYWASIAWGRYWGWDPKETSALVTWLIYAVYLHARSQRGWAGRPRR